MSALESANFYSLILKYLINRRCAKATYQYIFWMSMLACCHHECFDPMSIFEFPRI